MLLRNLLRMADFPTLLSPITTTLILSSSEAITCSVWPGYSLLTDSELLFPPLSPVCWVAENARGWQFKGHIAQLVRLKCMLCLLPLQGKRDLMPPHPLQNLGIAFFLYVNKNIFSSRPVWKQQLCNICWTK